MSNYVVLWPLSCTAVHRKRWSISMVGLQRDLLGWLVVAVLLSAAGRSEAATCHKYVPKSDYRNCVQLDGNLVLHWRTLGNATLEFALDGDGYMNWIAIGISEMGMKGVDFNIVIRGTEGLHWTASDFFTIDGVSTPALDLEQNVVLETAPNIDRNNHTLAIFQRPLDSCDAEDIPILLDVERSIIWAYNYGSNWEKDKLAFSAFSKGIMSGVRLYTSLTATVAQSAGSLSITLTMPSYAVPAANSTVTCVNLPLPNDTAYHVVSYKGFNTTPYVTRLAGYVCAAKVVSTTTAAYGVPYPCASFQTFMTSQSLLPPGCETLNFIWAPGASAFTAPPQAGFAIGAGAATSMVLQVYYQNPTGVVGKTDSSGFNLTYISQLRNATLGVLTLGNTDLRIPAAQDRYTALPNICPASCTGKRVLAPVTLVSNFYVMGKMGVASMTRHIRGGVAIQPAGRINYWDSTWLDFQTSFPGSRMLLANDTLISLCTYNSTPIARSLTVYGLNPWNELCFNYITFYPVSAMPDLDYCVADTRKNISMCATRTALARAASRNMTDAQMVLNGTKLPVGTLNISYYKSQECILQDQIDVTPSHPPNTRAAVASVVLVPIAMILVGVILWTKYSKQEEMEALLAQAREQGFDNVLVH